MPPPNVTGERMLRSIAIVLCLTGIPGCATPEQPIQNTKSNSADDCRHLYLGTGPDPTKGFGYHGAPTAKAQAECLKNIQPH